MSKRPSDKTILNRIAKLQKQLNIEVEELAKKGYNVSVIHSIGDDKLAIEAVV